jgi:hypothetical protein
MIQSIRTAAAVVLAFAATAAAGAADPTPSGIAVPRGIVIPILVTKDVRASAQETTPQARKVKLAVAQDVIVNGYVIARAGDLAEGHYDTQSNQTKRTFTTNVCGAISPSPTRK